MENSKSLVTDIYGDIDVCSQEEAKHLKTLKKMESDILSEYTMNFNKKFTSWW